MKLLTVVLWLGLSYQCVHGTSQKDILLLIKDQATKCEDDFLLWTNDPNSDECSPSKVIGFGTIVGPTAHCVDDLK